MRKVNPTKTKSWVKLKEHYQSISQLALRDLFARDAHRFSNFSLRFNNILIDYSKNFCEQKTIGLLVSLAQEIGLGELIDDLFQGQKINETEERAVLHTALRNKRINNQNLNVIHQEIQVVLERMRVFSEKIRNGFWLGYSNQPIKNIVNIGIGGSDLGPAMVAEALKFYASDRINIYFISNVDGEVIANTLDKLTPDTTLFMISSKSFSTAETLMNAGTAKKWFLRVAKNESYVSKHFVAMTSNQQKAIEFGIARENIYPLWDFVGGRFSLWSAVGLPIACYLGFEYYAQLLQGAFEADEHFRTAAFDRNIPVILGLLGIWYNNFYGAETEAIFPYDQSLHRLPAYLQQASMESNGKSVDRSGNQVSYQTGAILWGEPGTNGQHAFFQLIHQGTKLIPSTFLVAAKPRCGDSVHHKALVSNCFAQTQALMNGRTKEEVYEHLKVSGLSKERIEKILPFKVFSGNKPTTTILYDQLTPKCLGSLIAMFEHKIFVQGAVWNIFSFDQWGVELGKQLADNIFQELTGSGKKKKACIEDKIGQGDRSCYDTSTQGLLAAYYQYL